MDAKLLAEQILSVLRKNGFPGRSVRLPYHQIYRPAVDNGFDLADSLRILKRIHRVDSNRIDDRILFSPYTPEPPQCDSKTVDKAIRQTIRPLLKEAGFAKNRGRNSWRLLENTAAVVNFQSFNSHYAESYGCTTFSLAVNAGLYFRETELCPWASGETPELPKEHECHLRMSPVKPEAYDDKCTNPDIWYVEPDGRNVSEVIDTIADVLSNSVLPWMDRHLDRDHLLQRFFSTEIQNDESEAFFGAPYSPARANVICGVLISRRDIDSARQYLSECLSQDSSTGTNETLEEYYESFTKRFPPWTVLKE